jgi:hypothetical protein
MQYFPLQQYSHRHNKVVYSIFFICFFLFFFALLITYHILYSITYVTYIYNCG